MPNGKHIFGVVTIGDKGQIVIPKKARDVFRLSAGDQLLVLGDEKQGIALVKTDALYTFATEIMNTMKEGPVKE